MRVREIKQIEFEGSPCPPLTVIFHRDDAEQGTVALLLKSCDHTHNGGLIIEVEENAR